MDEEAVDFLKSLCLRSMESDQPMICLDCQHKGEFSSFSIDVKSEIVCPRCSSIKTESTHFKLGSKWIPMPPKGRLSYPKQFSKATESYING